MRDNWFVRSWLYVTLFAAPLAAPLAGCAADPTEPGSGLPVTAYSVRGKGQVPGLPEAPIPGDLPATDVVFQIDTNKAMRLISPDIYGVNSPEAPARVARMGSARLGGNRLSAYNWENNSSNSGNDNGYVNDNYLGGPGTPGLPVSQTMDVARATGASAVVTVPIGDYVAADFGGTNVMKTTDWLNTRFKKNKPRKGAAFANPPNGDDAEVYQDEFVSWVKNRAGDVPVIFSLDNEPDLWASTHKEIHSNSVTYDELCTRTVDYASAIKDVWPTAPVLGFVSYGWQGYISLQNAPDRTNKGEFVDYFLAQMQAAEQKAGHRLVDFVDLHYYPETRGAGRRIVMAGTPPTDQEMQEWQEARMQAPRSLWDPTYQDDSWIGQSIKVPIRLIPRMREKIDANYPGTKLAITEWNFGGPNDITGAIATADVLGIFGREGVDMAHLWLLADREPFTFAGLRIYRNYDGKGGEFGDVGVAADNSDTAGTSVYASLSSSNPGHVVVVAINKKNTTVKAGIQLSHPAPMSKARVYRVAGTDDGIAGAPDLTPTASNAFVYNMPARSVSVLVFDGTVPAGPVFTPKNMDAAVAPPVDAGGAGDAQ